VGDGVLPAGPLSRTCDHAHCSDDVPDLQTSGWFGKSLSCRGYASPWAASIFLNTLSHSL
jgi:hypothetical protein